MSLPRNENMLTRKYRNFLRMLGILRSRNVLARRHVQWFDALMSDHIYKKIELIGSSSNGIEDAVNNAITRAGKTIRNMKWFDVAEVRGHLENNKVADWQVTVKEMGENDRDTRHRCPTFGSARIAAKL